VQVSRAQITSYPVARTPIAGAPVARVTVATASVVNRPLVNAPLIEAPVANTPIANAPVAHAQVAPILAANKIPPQAPRPSRVSDDDLYRHAVASIQRRAYGEALGDLTAANAISPNDPRVLNAMGVAYDWLGRFDLSARYYDRAEAADPGSVVVAINRRYSKVLQRHGGTLAVNQVVMPLDASSHPVRIASAPPPPAPAPRRTAVNMQARKTASPGRETHVG
jgi:tetratricopeptide (TPR) repeat protein